MVKRITPPKPLTLAVIGSGSGTPKMTESLLADFTAPYEEVTLILPVDGAYWSDDIAVIYDWALDNDVPFVAVTTGGTPDKALVDVLEAADSVQKVARVSVKLVQLLQQEAAESDVALFVLWDDDDEEAVLAVNKALTAEVPAYNLLDGLDKFSFDDDDEEGAEEENEQHLIQEGKATNAELADEPDPDEGKFAPADEYDDWGVRKLRAALREHPNKKDTDRAIGQMDKDDAIKALRVADQAKLSGDEPEEVVQEVEDEEESPKAARTTRARRAFAEGAAEGTGDEAQAMPRSRGGDVLEDQDTEEAETSDDSGQNAQAEPTTDSSWDAGVALRDRALELAVAAGKNGAEAIADAMKYEVYLKGQRQSGGRPRADGTPAQPREIGEDGKPVRRRRASSTD